MVAAFGSARERKWSDHQLLENHPIVRVGGLRGPEVTVSVDGHEQIIQLEKNGRSDVNSVSAPGSVAHPAIAAAVRSMKWGALPSYVEFAAGTIIEGDTKIGLCRRRRGCEG